MARSSRTTAAVRGQRRPLVKLAVITAVVINLLVVGGLGLSWWLDARAQAALDRRDATHAVIYTIPKDAHQQFRSIREQVIDPPNVIHLTVGLTDTLRIDNRDTQPGRVGPFELQPGKTFRVQFQKPGTFPFACVVDEADSLTVQVAPQP